MGSNEILIDVEIVEVGNFQTTSQGLQFGIIKLVLKLIGKSRRMPKI